MALAAALVGCYEARLMSDTSKTETRRKRRHANFGKKRKKALAKNGTTPKFPIHPDGKKKD